MDDDTGGVFHSDHDDWDDRYIIIPRIGLRVSRHGMRRAIIWPGYYMVRWSRTYRRNVYRRR